MDSLVEKLERFGLKDFINEYRHELCERTVNQSKVAAFLHFDFDQSAVINHPPDNFSKCEKLYELIQKKSKVKDFIEALQETGNEHIIEFIESVDLSACGQSSSASASANLTMGIWFNIPEPIDSFYGREDFLTQLHDKLKPRDDSETEVTVLSQVKIVSGLGGIGKTETARKYIMKHRKFYNNFIWINAESENSLINSFLKLADELKIPVKNAQGKSRKIDEIVKEIYNKICKGGKSNLIIFDNAEDYQSCKNFFPFGLHPDLKKPVIFATSRNQDWISHTGKKVQVLPLDVLTESESLEFILKELEIPESDIPEFKEESKEFIELLGGLPLALQQAVAYIRQEKELRELAGTSYKISDYVQEFKSSMEKFLSFSPVPPPDSSPTVFVTWNVTFSKIQSLANGEEAVKILEILSFLYADKIPSSFLHSLVPEMKVAEFAGALKLLKKYSMIKNDVTNFSLSVHRQLQFVILQYLEKCNDVPNIVTPLIKNCTIVLENTKLPQSSDIFLNVHQIVNNPFKLIPISENFLDFQHKFGLILWTASQFSESLALCKKVYVKRGELLGEEHEKTLSVQHQIAVDLYSLGKYEESLALYKDALKKKEAHPDFGLDHPSTITTKHNIALVLQRQNKQQESLELLQQVLDQQTKIHGENHPSTLASLNQIALLHSRLGNFAQALVLYEDAERKQMTISDSDSNPPANQQHILIAKHNKAFILYKMGRIPEASFLFHEIYEKRKEMLGENHLDTVNTLGWIGVTLEEEGKSREAADVHKKVWAKRKEALGENHENTLGAQNVMAMNLLRLGKYDESSVLYKETLEKAEAHPNLGLDHPFTINLKHHMAKVLQKQTKYTEALQLLQQVLDQEQKVHGPEHSRTLMVRVSIASVHSDLGHLEQALTLYEDFEEKRKGIQELGSNHRDVLRASHDRAILLFKMGRVQEASNLFKEVYERRKEILGDCHLHTMNTLYYWKSRVLEQEGNLEQVLNIYKRVYECRQMSLGENHPDTEEVKSKIELIETELRE